MENIEKEDKYGQYIKSALSQVRDQERQINELLSRPPQSEDFRRVLLHIDDLEKIQELYSVEELEEIVDQAGGSVDNMEELHHRLEVFAELGREVNAESERFLEDFERNINLAEESREVFVQKVRNAISSAPTLSNHSSNP